VFIQMREERKMDDQKLDEILGTLKDVEPSVNFRTKFWQRVEIAEKRRSLVFKRLVPAFATLTILLIAFLMQFPKSSPEPAFLISQKDMENFSTEELLAETTNYFSPKTIATELLTSEEIFVALVPREIREEIREEILNHE